MLSARAIGRTLSVTGAFGVLALSTTPISAQAQTAADLNRAAAAMQLCASPAAAAIPQCAQLKQQMGLGGGGTVSAASGLAGALGALGAAKGGGAGAGGLAGALMGLASNAANANTNTNTVANGSAAAAQAAYVACVQRAGLNTGAIQACSQIVANWTGGAGGAPANVTAAMGSGDYYTQSALATQAAAASYQGCVAANPSNWQACLARMTGGDAAVASAAQTAVNLTGAALAGYQRCLQTNPAEKCAKAYGASAQAAAPVYAGGNSAANAVTAAQAAQQLAPTLKALGSLLGSR